MLIPNHPHDERLSALASGDPEAVADSVLSGHVASCHRCTDTVAELGALRASLAELPDLLPHRPLQLIPPVTDARRADRVGGWARRFFAPVLTAGAALALVGVVGTTTTFLPAAQSDAGDDAAAGLEQEMLQGTGEASPTQDRAFTGAAQSADPMSLGAEGAGDGAEAEAPAAEPNESPADAARQDNDGTGAEMFAFGADRPVWPMLLFAGVALMIAAVLLRWILAPRAD
jgi:hypothetical protein